MKIQNIQKLKKEKHTQRNQTLLEFAVLRVCFEAVCTNGSSNGHISGGVAYDQDTTDASLCEGGGCDDSRIEGSRVRASSQQLMSKCQSGCC